jgi:hypothetical protein
VIGHMKTDGRLDRNFLAGTRGDSINALLCGAGYNLRLLLNYLRRLLRPAPCARRLAMRRSRGRIARQNRFRGD